MARGRGSGRSSSLSARPSASRRHGSGRGAGGRGDRGRSVTRASPPSRSASTVSKAVSRRRRERSPARSPKVAEVDDEGEYSVEDNADESLLPPLKEPMEWWTTDERVDEDSSPIDNPNCEEQIELNSAVEIVIHGASFHIIGSAPSRVMNTHSSADKGTTLWLMSLGQRRISIAV